MAQNRPFASSFPVLRLGGKAPNRLFWDVFAAAFPTVGMGHRQSSIATMFRAAGCAVTGWWCWRHERRVVRFVYAIVSFVIAALMIGAGFAQRTVFLPPDEVVASVSVDSQAPVTVIDGETLNSFPRTQTVSIGGSSEVFAAYGRTSDVIAWVGNASYNSIGYDAESQQLSSELVSGTEEVVPDPAGSDLWLAEYSDSLALTQRVKVPEDVSFVIVSDGTSPAPANISISWPLDDSTPWVTPLLIGGGVVLLIGLGLLLWAITQMRRSRGPRRKQPKTPKLPKQPRYKPSKSPKALGAGSTSARRSTRTTMVAVPLALVSVLAVGGCAVDPASSASTPDHVAVEKSATVEDSSALPPAVTKLQATRIVERIADVAAVADEELDAKVLSERFAGPALALRTAKYKIKKDNKDEELPSPILDGPVRIILPQQNDAWPRTVFVVIQDDTDETVAPTALMLVQDDPRAQYLVHYAVNLEPGVTIPELAPEEVGAARISPDSPLYTVLPSELAAAYGDILIKGEKSDWLEAFDQEGDTLQAELGVAEKKKRQKKLPDTAKLSFKNAAGKGQVIVLATLDGGAIVAVDLKETETVEPVQDGATVNAPKGVKALSGKSVSTKGLKAVYGDQLLFYVPSTTTGGKVKLLGYDQGLIAASELKE
jgi:hypothetical protein